MRCLPVVFIVAPVFAHAEPLRVVTDIPPVHSLVSQIIGERGKVSVLLGENADPHHFQLRPSQSRDLAKADIVVWIGDELTPWLARARDGVATDIASLTLLNIEDDEGHSDEDSHEDESDHGHNGVDPHIWLSIHASESMLSKIAEHLGELDPEAANYYDANAETALANLEALEQDIERTLAKVGNVPFVVSHDAYGHFVDEFGLKQVDSLTDVHDSPASAKHISKLARLAESGDITCVFPEVGESKKLATVLEDKGARMGPALDPVGLSLELGPALHRELLQTLANDFLGCLSP